MSSTWDSSGMLRVGDVESIHGEKELSIGGSQGRVEAQGPAGRRPHRRAGLEDQTKQESQVWLEGQQRSSWERHWAPGQLRP